MGDAKARLAWRFSFFLGAALALVLPTAALSAESVEKSGPLRVIVMDPLSLPLSCACVKGTGQRRYDLLAEYLEERLGREAEVVFDESVSLARRRLAGDPHLIIGKRAMVRMDAAAGEIEVRPLADLTSKEGDTGVRGVFLVRKDDPAQRLTDLAGRRIALGPEEDEETNAAARRAILEAGIDGQVTFHVAGSIDAAALAVNDGEAEAAVVSAFLPLLLEGCGKLDRGTTKVIGQTESVPFITVFATSAVSGGEANTIREALFSLKEKEVLLAAMESSMGFVEPAREAPKESRAAVEPWTDWRGPGRRGWSASIPSVLPADPKRLWTAPLTGPAMAGVAATEKFVVVPDKDAGFTRDVIRCLDAATGEELWKVEYQAEKEMDYSNAPRATPVIHEDLVYLQGAIGDLLCLELETGKQVWRRNIFSDFGAELLTWGSSCAPLVVDDLLIVNPGAHEASVMALDRRTGEARWKTPGHPAGYAAFVIGTFDGVRQIVGYDTASLGGWDPKTGRRLWEFVPPDATDFNVTTPLILGEQILLATENNATRLYRFDGSGRLDPEPVAVNDDLAPDTCTPVVIHDRIYATAYGELFCVDMAGDFETLWSVQDDMFYDHSNVMAGNDRVLVWTMPGDLLLIRAEADTREYEVISRCRPFGEETLDSMAHPAIVGNRIYLRAKGELVCMSLE